MGEIRLVTLSPILYTTCDNSGEYPSSINSGIKTGAIIAHFAEALPMAILMVPARMMNNINRGMVPILILCKNIAPLIASISPK